ncbi:MAG TPA: TIR domain-containing protein [Pyrinomonadaceae bacterium]
MNNIFISQTSGKSRDVAIVLKNWLIEEMKLGIPWISTEIPGGDDWRKAIRKALSKARIGILCITADNITNQWIIYEAGALDFNGIKVFPYVINSRSRYLPAPINHLQGGKANEQGTKSLVIEINKALGKRFSKKKVIEIFNSKWKILQQNLENIHRSKDYEKAVSDFMKIIIVINDFRRSLDYSALVTEVLSIKEFNTEKIVDTVFKIIEKEREDFIKRNEFTNIEPVLTRKVRNFFKKHFKEEDLRNIITALEPILFSEDGSEKKRTDLLAHIRVVELEVFLRFHGLLADELGKDL